MDNLPTIKVIINQIEINLKVHFNMDCCQVMLERYSQGETYRSSFAKAIFYMYKETSSNNNYNLVETDFIALADEELSKVLFKILEQDKRIKAEYNKYKAEDIYERFYRANKIMSEELTRLGSVDINPHGYLEKLIPQIPAYDVIALPSWLNNLPNVEIAPAIQSMQSILESIPKPDFTALGSAIANIPQPSIDIQNIIAPLQNIADKFLNINNDLSESLLGMAKVTESLFYSIDFSLLTYRKTWSKQKDTLLKYGWFYSDEIPDDIVQYIYENQKDLDVSDVDKIIINYFRKNRCEALKCIVSKWRNLPYFECRATIFHEALVNHSRKYFNTSITMLTVHTEGIITDFVRINLQHPRYHIQKALEDIKRELRDNDEMSIYDYEVFSDVIQQIENTFNESFKHSNPDATSNKSRHKIAHGHAYEKDTEANSLKQFLYLNEIYNLFSLLNNQEAQNKNK